MDLNGDPMLNHSFKAEMEKIHLIKDASMDLYEACLAVKKSMKIHGYITVEVWMLMELALIKAEGEV